MISKKNTDLKISGLQEAEIVELQRSASLYFQQNDYRAAEPLYCKLLKIDEKNYQTQYCLGVIYYHLNNLEEAESFFEAAINLKSDFALAYHDLGKTLQKQKRYEEAADCFHLAIKHKNNYAKAYMSFGNMLQEQGKLNEAINFFSKAVEAQPDYAEAHMSLGYILSRYLNNIEQGIIHLNRAIILKPTLLEAHLNMGMALQYQGKVEEALKKYEYILQQKPDYTEVRLNCSLAGLLTGNFKNAWIEYEERKKIGGDFKLRTFPYPEWDGSDLTGKSILVYAEQGLGDQIMFASCLPNLISQTKQCFIECSPKLKSLFQRSFPEAKIYSGKSIEDIGWLNQLPIIDYQVAIGSLPLYFRNGIDQFPSHSGYLKADREKISYWKAQLSALGPGLKIGISWRGGTLGSRQQLRSFDLSDWLPLLRGDAHFINLQYTDCTKELTEIKNQYGITVHHWQKAIDDYDQTAALVYGVDLVISVCTSVIHLSGALGKPVWVMVPTVPEWRYGLYSETMPWYPSVKLFRQSVHGDWRLVIDKIQHELELVAKESPCSH